MMNKLFNKVVYATTKKPEHYAHVDKPKTFQDHRQVQYNNWCKRKGVYNGSYLPEDPQTLLKKGKGWEYATKHEEHKQDNKQYQRKSSKQIVRFDNDKVEEGILKEKHYHWEVGKSVREQREIRKNKQHEYIDRYGERCREKSPESHLGCLDKDYNIRNKKK